MIAFLTKVAIVNGKVRSHVFFSFFFLFFFVFRAAPTAYGGSQARGPVRAIAAGLSQSHSNTRSG